MAIFGGKLQTPNSKLQTPSSKTLWRTGKTPNFKLQSQNSLLATNSSEQPALARSQERRLFADGKFFTPDGKARFIFDAPRPVSEQANEEYPFVLLTGKRIERPVAYEHAHRQVAMLRTLYPANAYVEINPADAEKLGVAPNSVVAIISRRARIKCPAFISPTVQPSHVFIPMHYDVTNRLTRPTLIPTLVSQATNTAPCASNPLVKRKS